MIVFTYLSYASSAIQTPVFSTSDSPAKNLMQAHAIVEAHAIKQIL